MRSSPAACAPPCAAREPMLDAAHTGCRLVHAESDGLPGVVADRYGDVGRRAAAVRRRRRWRDAIVAALRRRDRRALQSTSARTPKCARSKACRRAAASLRGALPDASSFVEDGLRYRVDVVGGQKTGFYLDQRDNRRASARSRSGRRRAERFCYTGGFTLAALAGGARAVLSIDSSADALRARARQRRAPTALDAARAANGATPTCSPSCASCANSGASVRPDRARPAEVRADGARMRNAPRAPTRTSTCWR